MPEDVFGWCGKTLDGRYRVDALAGEGGFGLVYRGQHLSFDHRIAIKCLKIPGHFTTEAQVVFQERFREEGKMLSRLSQHPAVVRVYDYGLGESARGMPVPYLVLEWLEGRSLQQALAERAARGATAYSEAEALRLLHAVIGGLALAHRLGIAHRDIKPANIYLAYDDTTVKILDFGIAKAMQEGDIHTQLATGTASAFHAFTPSYGAPEQFRSKKYGATGPWTDVHALGLVLVELVTGRAALEGEDTADLLMAATGDARPTPRARGAEVSDGFEELCARALARDPKDRFSNAGELLAAVESLDPTLPRTVAYAEQPWSVREGASVAAAAPGDATELSSPAFSHEEGVVPKTAFAEPITAPVEDSTESPTAQNDAHAGLERAHTEPAPRIQVQPAAAPIGFRPGPRRRARLGLVAGVGIVVAMALGGGWFAWKQRAAYRIKVTTLAGSGERGYLDGPNAAAKFNHPSDVAVAPGHGKYRIVFVADRDNHRVRIVSAGRSGGDGDNRVDTFAGSGEKGFADGPAPDAMFDSPEGLVATAEGAVYVADTRNHRVREILRGAVTTFAGSGERGYADGPVAWARFNEPSDVAIGPDGAIYVADDGNHRIRVLREGMVATLAGTGEKGFTDGPAKTAKFGGSLRLDVDLDGVVYIADPDNHCVRALRNGHVVTVAVAGGKPWFGTSSRRSWISAPSGVAVGAEGEVYVSDRESARVGRIVGSTIAGLAGGSLNGPGFTDGPGPEAAFNAPGGLSVGPVGDVYVADAENQRIRVISEAQQ